MDSKIFNGDAPTILVGAPVQLKEEDNPHPLMSMHKFKDTLSEASISIRTHLQDTTFASYSLSEFFVNDVDNSGMILQRLEGGCLAGNGLCFDIDAACADLTRLSIGKEDSDSSSWRLSCKSCRTYAFWIIQGFNLCDFASLRADARNDAPFLLADLDYMSLVCLLGCRGLISKLEKSGLDIGLEIYIAFQSGDWLYLGYEDTYHEGVVICEHESGVSTFCSELLETISSNTHS